MGQQVMEVFVSLVKGILEKVGSTEVLGMRAGVCRLRANIFRGFKPFKRYCFSFDARSPKLKRAGKNSGR